MKKFNGSWGWFWFLIIIPFLLDLVSDWSRAFGYMIIFIFWVIALIYWAAKQEEVKPGHRYYKK